MNRNFRTHFQILLLSWLGCLFVHCARADDLVSVTCTNNGQGLFSFTFAHGDLPYVWGLSPDDVGDSISLPLFGVTQTFQPPGWTVTVDPNDNVAWSVTNGTVFLDSPVTFAVQSIYTAPVLYSTNSAEFNQGTISASAYYQSTHAFYFSSGAELFSFVGPDPNSPLILYIARAGGNAVLSWTTNSTGFVLEASGNIPTTNGWNAVTNIPVVSGAFNYVTNAIGVGNQFYRLYRP